MLVYADGAKKLDNSVKDTCWRSMTGSLIERSYVCCARRSTSSACARAVLAAQGGALPALVTLQVVPPPVERQLHPPNWTASPG